jgi:hypothetical protein
MTTVDFASEVNKDKAGDTHHHGSFIYVFQSIVKQLTGRPHEKKEFTKLKKGSHYLEQIQR